MKAQIKLGQRVKDKVTEFIGIAVAKYEYLNGCIQFHVSPVVDEKGDKRKDLWIDEQQLEIIDRGILPEPEKRLKRSKPSGGNRPGGGNRSHPG